MNNLLEDEIKKIVGRYFKSKRESKELTREELASKFSEIGFDKISENTIKKIENGNVLFPTTSFDAYRQYFGLSVIDMGNISISYSDNSDGSYLVDFTRYYNGHKEEINNNLAWKMFCALKEIYNIEFQAFFDNKYKTDDTFFLIKSEDVIGFFDEYIIIRISKKDINYYFLMNVLHVTISTTNRINVINDFTSFQFLLKNASFSLDNILLNTELSKEVCELRGVEDLVSSYIKTRDNTSKNRIKRM